MAGEAGSAFVEIEPRLSPGFQAQVTRDVNGRLRNAMTGRYVAQAGQAGGAQAAQGFNSRFGSGVRNGMSGIVRGVGGLLAGLGAARFFSGAIAEAEEAAAVGRQTQAVIASTGGAANVTAGQVDSLATALSRKAGVDDDLIASGQNVLLTFTNVANEAGRGNDIFTRATTSALDMSAALGTDMQSATMQLGKALNDPIRGMSTLTRSGVSFTQQQRDQVKAMVESGDTLGAQRLIMAEVERQFEGSAEANATASMRMKVAWDEIKETAGTALLPIVQRVADGLGTAAGWFQNLGDRGRTLATVFGMVGIAALAMWSFIGGPATLVILAFGAIAAAAYGLYTRFEPVRRVVDTVWAAIRNGVQTAAGFIRSFTENDGLKFKVLWAQIQQRFAPIISAVSGLWASLKKLGAALAPLKPLALAIAGALLLAFGGPVVILAALVAGIVWAYFHFDGFRNLVNTVASWWIGTFAPFMIRFWTSVVNGIATVITKVREWWNATEPVRQILVSLGQQHFQNLRTAIGFVVTLIRTWWAASQPVRSVLMLIGSIGFLVLKTAISNVITLVRTVWAASEPVRSVLAKIGGFALTALKSALSTVGSALGTIWEKSEPVRKALATIGGYGLDALKSAVGTIRDAFSAVSGFLDDIASKIRNLPSPSISMPSWVPGAARGGPVHGVTLVGEEGPELVNFQRRAFVTPADLTSRTLSGISGMRTAGGDGGSIGGDTAPFVVQLDGKDIYRGVAPRGRAFERGYR